MRADERLVRMWTGRFFAVRGTRFSGCVSILITFFFLFFLNSIMLAKNFIKNINN